ncbi:MAG TPA: DNA polymerase III subunit delta [Tepidisphaeraceae bacterium]|jgi:DNA polymerase-3 subunit delta|nr:DNA polymerase III subunit delta [Tepidisphaeraceae bacterium]
MAVPVYALVGSDSFLQLEALSRLLASLPADVQRIDLDGERAQLADVLDELRSFAMFGSGKVVVVRDADDFISRFREQLEDYLAKPSDSGTLVLRVPSLPANQRIAKLIAKVGKIEACEPPKAAALPKWIVDRARSVHGLKVAGDAAQILADLVGDDMGRLDGELSKLALQVEGNVATAADVTLGVAFQREQEMWDMTNELAAGRVDKAMQRWRQLTQLDSSTEFRAVTWLSMWLENVRKALAMKRQGMAPGAIASALRLWPREMQGPFFKTADTLGDAGVARAIDLLAQIDKQSKSGIGDAAANVERFMLTLATR